MPQMSPILWNFTSIMSFLTLLFIMSNFIYPISTIMKKNLTKKKKNMLLMW